MKYKAINSVIINGKVKKPGEIVELSLEEFERLPRNSSLERIEELKKTKKIKEGE